MSVKKKYLFQELAVFSHKLLKADGPQLCQFGPSLPFWGKFYPIERLKRLTAQVLRTQPDIFKSYTLPGSIRLRTQIARRSLQLVSFSR